MDSDKICSDISVNLIHTCLIVIVFTEKILENYFGMNQVRSTRSFLMEYILHANH